MVRLESCIFAAKSIWTHEHLGEVLLLSLAAGKGRFLQVNKRKITKIVRKTCMISRQNERH